MTVDEILALVFIICFLAVSVFGLVMLCKSAEKTEEKKRELMSEVTRYYRNRNKQFEEENK